MRSPPPEGPRSWISNSTPALAARSFSASPKSTLWLRMTKPNMSPPSPQPKQCHVPVSGKTMNDGVFSMWKGHNPFRLLPAFLRVTASDTTSTISRRALIWSTAPPAAIQSASLPLRNEQGPEFTQGIPIGHAGQIVTHQSIHGLTTALAAQVVGQFIRVCHVVAEQFSHQVDGLDRLILGETGKVDTLEKELAKSVNIA